MEEGFFFVMGFLAGMMLAMGVLMHEVGFQLIKLTCSLYKITSTSDGGWRITFDVPDSDRSQVQSLMNKMNQVLIAKISTDQWKGGDDDGEGNEEETKEEDW